MDIPNLKHLNAVDYLVVVCYLLIVAGVGIYVRKYNKSTQDYFKAGGKLPWLISSLSLFVSGFSAYMFVAASGFVYRNGMVSILVFTSAFGAYWLGYFVYGRLWRRARLDSPMEVLTRRFSQSTTYFYSIIAVIPNILLMGALFYTLSIFISSALGLGKVHIELGHFSLSGFELTLVSIGLILLLYTTLGGLWAVAVTDTIQFIILLLMTLMVFPLSFMQLGNGSFIDGWQNLWQQAPVGYLDWNFENVAIIFLVAFWLMNLMGYNANWHIGQRYYSIADERDTKKMALLCAIFSLIAPILWIMPVLAAKIVFPDLHTIWPELTEPTEASFVSLCLTLLPHGFLGIIVSAMLAASMSSADSTFNWLAAVITKDVYVPIAKSMKKNEEPSDRWQLIVGKTTVLIIGIVAIFVSLSMQKFGSAFDIYLKIYSITVPSLLVPVMLGLIYRKTPWWSAIAASSIAILCTLIANVLANVMAGISVQGIGEIFNELKLSFMGITIGRFEINVFVGTGVSALVFLLSSKWPDKKAEDIKRIIAFDKDLRTPARGDKLHVDVRGIQSYKMIGLLSGLVGLLLIALSLFTNSLRDFLINSVSGTGAILFGLFFWLMARNYMRQK